MITRLKQAVGKTIPAKVSKLTQRVRPGGPDKVTLSEFQDQTDTMWENMRALQAESAKFSQQRETGRTLLRLGMTVNPETNAIEPIKDRAQAKYIEASLNTPPGPYGIPLGVLYGR